jgi:tRNA(Ile)-lysidine synthase TilS/MesJ
MFATVRFLPPFLKNITLKTPIKSTTCEACGRFMKIILAFLNDSSDADCVEGNHP